MRKTALFFFFVFFWNSAVNAEINNVCWTSPTLKAVVDLSQARFSSNEKGSKGQVRYTSSPLTFGAICNRTLATSKYSEMTHYLDLGSALVPSTQNYGWQKLTEDIDVRITPGDFTKPEVPFGPDSQLLGTVTPPYPCNECRVEGFSVAGSGYIEIMLRRDLIGGAIVIPPDLNLFKAYRVANMSPYPARAKMPMVELYTSPYGHVIPIPSVCSINNGNVINVNFGEVPADSLTTTVSQENKAIDILLSVSCNTGLTQDATVRLVSGTASFSNELIRTNNIGLGVAVKHNGKIIKPQERFPLRLLAGKGQEKITLFPVKNPQEELKLGGFMASATLVIESL